MEVVFYKITKMFFMNFTLLQRFIAFSKTYFIYKSLLRRNILRTENVLFSYAMKDNYLM